MADESLLTLGGYGAPTGTTQSGTSTPTNQTNIKPTTQPSGDYSLTGLAANDSGSGGLLGDRVNTTDNSLVQNYAQKEADLQSYYQSLKDSGAGLIAPGATSPEIKYAQPDPDGQLVVSGTLPTTADDPAFAVGAEAPTSTTGEWKPTEDQLKSYWSSNPDKLEEYWAANPDKLKEAIAANPDAFADGSKPIPTEGPGGQAGNTGFRGEFLDQGDGVYRGWKSGGPGVAVNTINEDGSVQGTFRDTRGNEFRGDAVTADSMTEMDVANMSPAEAEAYLAAKNDRTVTDDEMSSNQLNDILSQDSPLMSLARQDGIDMANSRGLANSSLAAGASMREMTRQATPLAMQQAQAYKDALSQNQQLESMRLDSNANRETDISKTNAGMEQESGMFNADAENRATSQEFGTEADMRNRNAALETDVNMQNASEANDMLDSDRQRALTYNMQQLVGDQDYAKQTLASGTAKEIAVIEGEYKQLISTNDTAGRVMLGLQEGIADVLQNDKIKSDEATVKIQALIDNADDTLGVIGAMNDLDLAGMLSSGNTTPVNGSVEIDPNTGQVMIDGQPLDLSNFDPRTGINFPAQS